jgi:hypothetical protein
VSLSAVVPRPGGIGDFTAPLMDGEIRISASNHKPMDGIAIDDPTDFTSEFFERCHNDLRTTI